MLSQQPDSSDRALHPERLDQIVTELRGVVGGDWRGVSAAQLQAHMRSRFLVPLEVLIDEALPEHAVGAIRSAVTEVLISTRRNRSVRYIVDDGAQANCKGAQSYIDSCLSVLKEVDISIDRGFGPQLISDILVSLLAAKSDQTNPHTPLLILGRDMASINTAFLFSSASSSYPLGLMSIARFLHRDLDDVVLNAAIQKTVKYTLGHMFGLPGRVSSDSTIPTSLGDNRVCANICPMRNALSAETWVQYAEQEAAMDSCYCADCTQHLQEMAARLFPVPT